MPNEIRFIQHREGQPILTEIPQYLRRAIYILFVKCWLQVRGDAPVREQWFESTPAGPEDDWGIVRTTVFKDHSDTAITKAHRHVWTISALRVSFAKLLHRQS
jgi:hypothetical protein